MVELLLENGADPKIEMRIEHNQNIQFTIQGILTYIYTVSLYL